MCGLSLIFEYILSCIETLCIRQAFAAPVSTAGPRPRNTAPVPKLWNNTIEAHRRDVGDSILDAASVLVAEHGLQSVTMSEIARASGIGRATLYKYYPDAESVLFAWHERQVARHLEELNRIRDRPGDAWGRLGTVLEAYALIVHQRHGNALAMPLHGGKHVAHAEQRLHDLIRALLADAAGAGDVREDLSPSELATYCLHALGAAGSLPSKAAVRRLVEVTRAGLRSQTRLPAKPALPRRSR
jgi:AcrR family transcriptional regulator